MSLSSAGLPHRSYASEDSEPLPGHAAPELHSARVLMGGSMNGAPMLVGATPADNSGQVTVGSNIVLTFNTAMAAGAGNIVISDGYLQSYIDKAGHTQTRWVGATDSHVVNVSDSQVTISGDTVTIDLTGNLKPGVSYNVTMAAGVLKDSGNHPFAGLLDSSKLNFATDSGIVTQVSAVALSTDTGSSASDFYTSAVHQTISGSINTLPAGGKVKVSIDGGATFVDAAVNSANHTWSLNTDLQDGTQQLIVHVTDASTQVIATYSHNYTLDTHAASQSLATVTPDLNADDDSSGASNSDNITNVAQPHVTVHIGDAYQLHSGDVVQIVDSNHGNAIVGSYTLLDTNIQAYGGNFSIQLDHALSDGEHDLKVQIGDLAGNAPATASNTALAVTIDIHAPTLLNTSPAANAHGVLTNTTIVLTFDEAIDLRASAAFSLTDGTDIQQLGVEAGQVSVDGNKIMLTLNQPLNIGSNYHLYMDGGEITDLAGNPAYAGADHLLDFTTTDDGNLQLTPHIVASATSPFASGSTDLGGQFYSSSASSKVQLLDGNTWVDAQSSSLGNNLYSWSAHSSAPTDVAAVRIVDAGGVPQQYLDYGNSVLYFGSSGNNTIIPGGNKSIVFSGDGDDTVTVGNSSHIFTGNGNDIVLAGNSASVITGNGNNSITVGNSASVIAGSGNNTITVGNSASLITGSGTNTVIAGNDVAINSNGYDLLHVGSNATVSLHGSGSTVDANGSGLALTTDNGGHSIILNSLDVASIATGSGNDTLNLSFDHDSFTLASLSGDHHMSGIDIVNMTGSGNTISVGALTDVTALSGTHMLAIAGNASTIVNVDSGAWHDTLGVDGSGYEIFHGIADPSVTLLVLVGMLPHVA